MATKTVNYSETEKKIVSALAESENAMTLAEIGTAIEMKLTSGNVNALVKKGNIEVVGDRETVCPTCGKKSKVKEYKFVKAI